MANNTAKTYEEWLIEAEKLDIADLCIFYEDKHHNSLIIFDADDNQLRMRDVRRIAYSLPSKPFITSETEDCISIGCKEIPNAIQFSTIEETKAALAWINASWIDINESN